MPYYTKSEDWLKQSSLLIEARPATTKVTTTYTVKTPRKESSSADERPETTTSAPAAAQKKSYGHLILKTYDPVSGTCLKYRTSKAAEVSRLIQMLGTLGKKMAGVSEPAEEDIKIKEEVKDEVMIDAPVAAAAGSGASTPAVGGSSSAPAPAQGGGGVKGKKKKGKR